MKTSVNFLGTRVKFSRDRLMTKLFCKSTSLHLYLHWHYEHSYGMIKSNPIQIFVHEMNLHGHKDYWKHINDLIWHYIQGSCHEL